MKKFKFKLLILTSTLLIPGATALARNESRIETSFVARSGIKKAISYNENFSFELFNGETVTETPSWAEVKNSDKGGEVIEDEATGVQIKVYGSSTSAYKYNHNDNTAFAYNHSIKTGGNSSDNRYIGVTIPEGVTAKIKAELYSTSERTIFVDELPSSTIANENVLKGKLVLTPNVQNDFVSEELEEGTYYFNFSGAMYIGKFVVEMTGLTQVNFMDNETLLDSRAVKTGNKVTALSCEDKLGQKFLHWSTTPNGTAFDFDTAITEETTLYAVFEDCDTYTVTFNLNYSGSINNQVVVNEGATVSKPEEDPTRPGYKFESWYYNNKTYNFKTLVTEDMTLFAKWTLDSVPVINGPESLRFGYSKPTDIEAILLLYSATDLEDEEVTLKLEKDTYSLNAQEIGSYEITLSATDSSGNKTTKVIPVEVYDDLAPVFDAPTAIYKSTSVALTTNDILKEIKATDAIDGKVDIEVTSDSYTGYANKVGNYALNLLAKDKNGNRRTFTLNINVSDKIANVWYVPEKTINVQSNIQLTSQDVINLLISTKELNSGYSSIDVTSNYSFDTDNQNEVGIYSVSLKARYFSGEEIMLVRTINVYESNEATQKRDNWFMKGCKWFYNTLIKNPCNFFIRIYNEFVKLIGHKEWQRADYLKGITIYE